METAQSRIETSRPITAREHAELRRELFAISSPYVAQQVRILSMTAPTIIRHTDGAIEAKHSADVLARLDAIEGLKQQATASVRKELERPVRPD
jgi:hypothetical protein